MLSDATLRNIKPEAANYKLADRDGMYVTVTPKGTITFRFDYRINGRRETLTIGRYGARRGMSLQMARELCVDARRAIAEGRSPSHEKQREKRRVADAKTFEEFTNLWLEDCWRRTNIDHLCRLNFDQGLLLTWPRSAVDNYI